MLKANIIDRVNCCRAVGSHEEEWRAEYIFLNTLLLPVASTVNPFIYALFSAAFKERVKKLLGCVRMA